MESTYNEFKFINIKEKPFKIYGLYNPLTESNFRRAPQAVADATSVAVSELINNTTGGRIRFKTNSKKIAIHVSFLEKQAWFAAQDVAFSVYTKYLNTERFCKIMGNKFPPRSIDMSSGNYELYNSMEFPDGREREITIHMPQFGFIKEIEIGILSDATLSEHSEYERTVPIVFYGSSIVHGCGARPGQTYPELVSRHFNSDFLNLGFSGNAKAEDAIMEYIASLDMSVFVFDYDHNAPTVEYLQETHLKGYKKIREKHPDLPIIIASRPSMYLYSKDEINRRIVVQKTYQYGIENGDENLYYLDGYSLIDGDYRFECTTDGTHPNALGYTRMATAMIGVLTYIFDKAENK